MEDYEHRRRTAAGFLEAVRSGDTAAIAQATAQHLHPGFVEDGAGNTALHVAAACGHADIVKLLLHSMGMGHLGCMYNLYGLTPVQVALSATAVHRAARDNTVLALVEGRASLRNSASGLSTLHVALRAGAVAAVEPLLAYKAEVHMLDIRNILINLDRHEPLPLPALHCVCRALRAHRADWDALYVWTSAYCTQGAVRRLLGEETRPELGDFAGPLSRCLQCDMVAAVKSMLYYVRDWRAVANLLLSIVGKYVVSAHVLALLRDAHGAVFDGIWGALVRQQGEHAMNDAFLWLVRNAPEGQLDANMLGDSLVRAVADLNVAAVEAMLDAGGDANAKTSDGRLLEHVLDGHRAEPWHRARVTRRKVLARLLMARGADAHDIPFMCNAVEQAEVCEWHARRKYPWSERFLHLKEWLRICTHPAMADGRRTVRMHCLGRIMDLVQPDDVPAGTARHQWMRFLWQTTRTTVSMPNTSPEPAAGDETVAMHAVRHHAMQWERRKLATWMWGVRRRADGDAAVRIDVVPDVARRILQFAVTRPFERLDISGEHDMLPLYGWGTRVMGGLVSATVSVAPWKTGCPVCMRATTCHNIEAAIQNDDADCFHWFDIRRRKRSSDDAGVRIQMSARNKALFDAAVCMLRVNVVARMLQMRTAFPVPVSVLQENRAYALSHGADGIVPLLDAAISL